MMQTSFPTESIYQHHLSGYTVMQLEWMKVGQVVIEGTYIYLHPLDLIAIKYRDPLERLEHSNAWIIEHGNRRFAALRARIREDGAEDRRIIAEANMRAAGERFRTLGEGLRQVGESVASVLDGFARLMGGGAR